MRSILTLVFLFVFSISKAQLWVPTRIANMPRAVSNNAVCGAMVNGQMNMYSFGGIDTSKVFSGITQEAYKWQRSNNTWSVLPSLPDTLGKVASAASNVKGKIYIIGGYHVYANGSEKSSSRVHIFDPQTDSYLADGAAIPFPIDDQVQCVWRDSLIYVITGWSDVANVSRVQVYNPSQNSWQQATPVATSAFEVFGSQGVIRNDTIYYYGGANMGINFPATDLMRIGVIDSMNPTDINWLPFLKYTGHPLYRMIGLPNPDGKVSFLGGSSISYNYNGISYASAQGVPPADEQIVFDVSGQNFGSDYSYNFPMDLRGYADFTNSTKYICGGMRDSQRVSNWAYQLDFMQGVGTTDWAKKYGLQIYPNPTRDLVHIQLNRSSKVQIKLLNSVGQLISMQKLGKLTRLNLKELPTGQYFLVFLLDGETYVEQIHKL